jgi:hypothetical protein
VPKRHRQRLLTLLPVMLLLAACGAFTDNSAERLEAGTVVMGVDQEPSILNGWLGEGNLQATHTLELAMLYPLWRLTPDFEYEPLLLEGEPEVTEDPFTVTYRLKDEATWSDGVPITAEDIRFTLETCLNDDFAIAVRAGCEKVDLQASEVVDDKTFTMARGEGLQQRLGHRDHRLQRPLPVRELEPRSVADPGPQRELLGRAAGHGEGHLPVHRGLDGAGAGAAGR